MGLIVALDAELFREPEAGAAPAGSGTASSGPPAAGDRERLHARHHAALSNLSRLTVETDRIEPLAAAVCAAVVEVMGADAAAFLELDGDAAVLRASAGLPPERLGERIPAGPARLAALSAGSTLAGGAALLLAGLGFSAGVEAVLPERADPSVLGAYRRAPQAFGPDDLHFLEMAANLLASVAARRRAERALLDRERLFGGVFDLALDAFFIVDDRLTVLHANPAAALLLGVPREALAGRALPQLAPGSLARTLGERLAQLPVQAGRLSGEAELALPGQPTRTVELGGVPGVLPGRHLVVLHDATEERQLRARLAVSDRAASLGALAGGVAHELNNPLASISANLTYLEERLARLEEAPSTEAVPTWQLRDAVRDAQDGVDRLRRVVRSVRTFTRSGQDPAGGVDLAALLQSCVDLAWSEIRGRARLVRDLAEVPPVRGDEARLGQLFLGLLVEAARAIPEGAPAANEVRLAVRLLQDGRVEVEVRDTGIVRPPGSPAPNLSPGGQDGRTGLGLEIARDIVASCGGELAVERRRAGGTRVRVVLPPSRAGEPAPPPASRVPARHGRVLVVDDEPLVGGVLQRSLDGEHEVTVVDSAQAALGRLDSGEAFDVIISDLIMPEMSGMDLYRELSRRQDGLAGRVVFITGGAFTPAAREFLDREPVTCIEKPFKLETIRAMLAERLRALPL